MKLATHKITGQVVIFEETKSFFGKDQVVVFVDMNCGDTMTKEEFFFNFMVC